MSIKKAFSAILRRKKCYLHCLFPSGHWPSCSRHQGSGAGAQWPSCRCLWPGLSGLAHSTHRQGCRAQLHDSGSNSRLADKLPLLCYKIKEKGCKQSSREQELFTLVQYVANNVKSSGKLKAKLSATFI